MLMLAGLLAFSVLGLSACGGDAEVSEDDSLADSLFGDEIVEEDADSSDDDVTENEEEPYSEGPPGPPGSL